MNFLNIISAVFSFSILTSAFQAVAGVDHSTLINGSFKNGSDVTKQCLKCHEKQAKDFIKTTHWRFAGTPNHIEGMEKSKKVWGKSNLINNFCTTAFNGPDGITHEACFKCHPGYGWNRSNFDLNDMTKIDCLICHAKDGNYQRSTIGVDIDYVALRRGTMDLEKAAKSVGRPAIKNCGDCHFYCGGGDGVKNPGIDSSLISANKNQDIHMAAKNKGGAGLVCQDCHITKDHKISGASSQLAHFDGHVNCEDCHIGANAPHKNSPDKAAIDKHISSVACQTCHIPVFAKGQATRMAWYWSDTGKNIESQEVFEQETYSKKRGSFKWGMDVVPVYAWYNGKVTRYLTGDRVEDPSKPVVFTAPTGNIKDSKSKIYPYKKFEGSMPMDLKHRYFNTFQQYKSLWEDYDWEKALIEGSKCKDFCLPYSGKYQFVNTVAFIGINHEVAPKDSALKCNDCHNGGKRMDWSALGYKDDPVKSGGRKSGVNLK